MTKQTTEGYVPETCVNLDHLPHIKGFDFNKQFDFEKFMSSFATTGFQATNLGEAIENVKAMIREGATIFLACTSNMISSGNREIIRYLVEHKLIHVLVTTAGGIEEDVIKTLKPFVKGSFTADGKYLFEKGINRIGNIFVTNDRYTYFEKFMRPFLEEMHDKQKELGRAMCTHELLKELGNKIEDKTSILHWASKNDIPVFCPAPTDGALGDMLFFTRQKHNDMQLDLVADMEKIVKISLNAEKTGVIALGGGVAKHHVLNAQIFREGCEYSVFINTGHEWDGSDSGACHEEAVSWGKIKPDALRTKVTGDATIIFPLVMASVLQGLKKDKADD